MKKVSFLFVLAILTLAGCSSDDGNNNSGGGIDYAEFEDVWTVEDFTIETTQTTQTVTVTSTTEFVAGSGTPTIEFTNGQTIANGDYETRLSGPVGPSQIIPVSTNNDTGTYTLDQSTNMMSFTDISGSYFVETEVIELTDTRMVLDIIPQGIVQQNLNVTIEGEYIFTK